MFHYISGEIVGTEMNTIIIDSNGIGYRLTVSSRTLGTLKASGEKNTKLFTFFSVKDDGVELYGFFDEEELSAFKLLISVSGVGPKGALSILSLYSPSQFASFVASGDAKSISKASGIGAKTAARVIVDLKDKIAKSSIVAEEDWKGSGMSYSSTETSEEAINALLVLGYTKAEAEKTISSLDSSLSTENLIKEALKILSR